MKILIIGSKGFIGNNLINNFRHKYGLNNVFGCDVFFEVNAKNYFTISPDSSDFSEIFRNHQFDICVNCSGAANVADSIVHPWRDFQLNTINVFKQLDAIRQFQPSCKYLNLSSAAVYGNPIELPIAENSVLDPISPYGCHKLQAEFTCKEFHLNFGLLICSVRIFSAYGPGLRKQIFWDLYQKTLTKGPITLFGTGNESRDFIYIDDLVRAIDLVIHNAVFQAESYNLGNGVEITISQAVDLFYNNFGTKVEFSFNRTSRSGDPDNWCADISLIKKMGYSQKISLVEGLRESYRWIALNAKR